jgi:transposase-like protein
MLAVKLIREDGYSVKEVSQELEVHENSLYRWVQEVKNTGIRLSRGMVQSSQMLNIRFAYSKKKTSI